MSWFWPRTPAAEDERSGGRARRLLIAAVAVAVPVSAIAAVTLNGGFAGRDRAAANAAGPEPAKTVAVTRTDLSDVKEFGGTIGFGAPQPLTGRRAGTITWLPQPATEIARGGPLYKVDNRPVFLFYGDTPLFRKVGTVGLKGPDVRVVKKNLNALGYHAGKRLEEFTEVTASAVKAWQKANGLAETGAIEVGDAVVLPGKVRVDALKVRLGDPAETQVLAVTGATRALTVAVDRPDIDVAKPGTKVKIILPNGTEAQGTVAKIDTASQSAEHTGDEAGTGSPGDQGGTDKVNVPVTIDDKALAGHLESGPVRVRFTAAARRGVLAVPVSALLALREGGYAVQVRDGAKTTLVGVQTGMFGDGLVEISGPGLKEGQRVVVAS